MRKVITSILGLSLLAGAAMAQVNSTPLSLNKAIIQDVSVTGTVVDGVSFSIPTAVLNLQDGSLQPGTNFNITLPVQNNTSRPITVSFEDFQYNATAQALVQAGLQLNIVSSSASSLGPNQTGTFVFNVSWNSADAPASLAGQTATVSFDLKGTFSGTPSNQNQSF